jgi:hypothetical protein
VTEGANTKLRVESVEEDGSPRDFFSTTAAIVGPTLEGETLDLVQVAPGVYEQDLGEIDPGAYSVRVTQTRPGTAALGRTLGLVSPTAAEYRILGPNEPFLAALRGATGGVAIEDPAQVWTHDLTSTSRFTDLWPILLILALILWPLDIAFRRVSIGRREFVAARGWVSGVGRRKTVAPRPAVSEGLLAARNRASSAGARSALLAEPEATPVTAAATTAASAPAPAPAPTPTPTPKATPAPAQAAPQPAKATPPPPPAPAAPAQPASSDTMARLRDAKRRARER